jgi:hypothetical protein
MQGSFTAAMTVIAGLATAGQTTAPFEAAYADGASDLCGIYLEESPEGLYLAAYAAEGVAGEYVLSLRQEGPGGTSQVTQSGEIEPDVDGPTLLSEMTLTPGGHFEASLQTYGWDGSFLCRAIV